MRFWGAGPLTPQGIFLNCTLVGRWANRLRDSVLQSLQAATNRLRPASRCSFAADKVRFAAARAPLFQLDLVDARVALCGWCGHWPTGGCRDGRRGRVAPAPEDATGTGDSKGRSLSPGVQNSAKCRRVRRLSKFIISPCVPAKALVVSARRCGPCRSGRSTGAIPGASTTSSTSASTGACRCASAPTLSFSSTSDIRFSLIECSRRGAGAPRRGPTPHWPGRSRIARR